MRVPPAWVRRPLGVVAVLVGLVLGVLLAPVLLLVAAASNLVVAGRFRAVRLLAFLLVWTSLECLALLAAVGLGAASCLIQVTMNWAQQSVSPTRATVIYAGEPVWGGIVGRLAGDRLPGLAIAGAVLIVAGVLVSELRPRPRGQAVPGRGTPRASVPAGRPCP